MPSETVTVKSTFRDTNGCSFSRQDTAMKMAARQERNDEEYVRSLANPFIYLFKMNHLNITVVRGANRVLYGCGRETFLEEAVHMARKDSL